MNDATPADATPLSPLSAWRARLRPPVVAIAWLVAVALAVFAAFFVAIGGRWGTSTAPLNVAPPAMALSRGAGQISSGYWVVTGLDASGSAILAFSLPALPAADFPSLVWDIEGGEGATLTLVWRSDREPGKVLSRRLDWTQDQVRVALRDEPAWQGRIGGVALVIQGSVAAPIRVGTVTLEPLSPSYTLRQLLAEWTAPGRWQQRSINFVHGGSAAPLAWLPLAAAIVLGVGVLGYAGYRRMRHARPEPAVLWLMLALAWVAVDARWIAAAWQRTAQTVATFSGKGEQERMLAAEDGVVYAFVARVRPLLEKEQGRLFLFSDVPYYRGRAAYQLLPLNVFHDLRAPKPPAAAAFRPGDVLVLFQQRGVAFNAAESRVRWTDGQTLDVAPLLIGGGNAVFRVR